ncbi:uncharacterized protein F5147DRAFT_768437 [Suillus discolor]|uniref:Uncharacterized protein n=1 Tax=Suillus discolor TaxID=1912936 RepID=A0A9P7JZ01_9AGAM|nr:uncharacterized protein F5147DRAFT_768437 [Suillus discolor]KAG2117053.1 hypothetical protein F5147DRAFT_768437 [Suillus discolor]
MGRHRKPSPERKEARKHSKRIHYAWHLGYERIKARHRWRRRQGATEATLDAFHTMEDLWTRTYTGGSRNHNGCEPRIIALLQNVDEQGWSAVRPGFAGELAEARILLEEVETLASSVTNLEGPCTVQLMTECSRLLCRARLWLASEEEILRLMDEGPDVLDDALFTNNLVWQRP